MFRNVGTYTCVFVCVRLDILNKGSMSRCLEGRREGRGRLKGRGWAPQDLIEHCNDRASDDRGRNAYSQATYFKSSAIKCADKSKHNSTAQIGGASYHHAEERKEETEGGR